MRSEVEVIMNLSFDKAQKIKTFFKIVGFRKGSLNNSIKEAAKVLNMQNNSAKNYYYKTLKFLQDNPLVASRLDINLQNFEIKKFDKFKTNEKFDLLKTVEDNLKKGISVRATCMKLANNDAKVMLRLQNKYRNMVKVNSKSETNNNSVVEIEKQAYQKMKQRENSKNIINIATAKAKNSNVIGDQELNALFLGLVRIVKKTALENVSKDLKQECKMATENFRQTLIDLNKTEEQLKKEQIKNLALKQQVESQKEQICKLLKELGDRKLNMLEKKSQIKSLKLKSFLKSKTQNDNIL